MTVEEVPDYIRAPAIDPQAKASELVLGPRKRKAVDYTTDRISDREYFDRTMGKHEDRQPVKKRKADSESAPRSSRKRKIKSEPGSDQPTPKRAPGNARRKTAGRTDRTPKGKRAKSVKGKSGKTSKAKKGKPIDPKWMAEVCVVIYSTHTCALLCRMRMLKNVFPTLFCCPAV